MSKTHRPAGRPPRPLAELEGERARLAARLEASNLTARAAERLLDTRLLKASDVAEIRGHLDRALQDSAALGFQLEAINAELLEALDLERTTLAARVRQAPTRNLRLKYQADMKALLTRRLDLL